MYSFVFCCVFIALVEFRLHCVTTVTPIIKRTEGSLSRVDSAVPLMHHDPSDLDRVIGSSQRKAPFKVIQGLSTDYKIGDRLRCCMLGEIFREDSVFDP